jgi:hypothetical protein
VKRLLHFFSSLRLTVALLSLFALLVFIGTLGQVELGLWEAQARYFRSFFLYWRPGGGDFRIPVFPGGYLLGALLLINLLTAHWVRFTFSRKKAGIFLIHLGLIMLLLGQVITDVFQVESNMRLREGQQKNYSESTFNNELAIVDVTNPQHDRVYAFKEGLLKPGAELKHSELPFTLRVKEYQINSVPKLRGPMVANEPPQATHGLASRVGMEPLPKTSKMNDKNIPYAVVEIVAGGQTVGSWLVSNWLVEESLLQWLQRQWGAMIQPLLEAQQFTYQGKSYQLALRPERYYKEHWIELLDFKHDTYKGTDIPSNFSSRVRVKKPAANEDREVLIFMNNPLRYAGETYYQASFEREQPDVTVLQVVRNPGWLTPYAACLVAALGMTVQFLSHLWQFARKRKSSTV